jgi:serine/threonine protein phosphatase PrpC
MNNCPKCGAACKAGDAFCQDCGAILSAPTLVLAEECRCGSTRFRSDGVCARCGRPRPALAGEFIVGPGLAAATDAGIVHQHNDDAFAIAGNQAGGAGSIVVVCDGVSNSQTPDLAAQVGVQAARDAIVAALANDVAAEEAVRWGITKAHDAVCRIPYDRTDPLDSPAATIAIAVVLEAPGGRRHVTTAWLGDSRVYWLRRSGGLLLTRDHSWRNMVVDQGEMSDQDARKSKMAHAIVKCLGLNDHPSDPTMCPEPSIETVDLPANGWLMVCTDGLWNYAEAPTALAEAADDTLLHDDALEVCRKLVNFAKGRGGHDNITIGIVKL